MEEIMKRAQTDLQQTQTAIYETALPLYKKYFPNADRSDVRGQTQSHRRCARQTCRAASQ